MSSAGGQRRVVVLDGSEGRRRAIVRQLRAEGLEAEGASELDPLTDGPPLAVVVGDGFSAEDRRDLDETIGEDEVARFLFREGVTEGDGDSGKRWQPIDARSPGALVRALLGVALRQSERRVRENAARYRSLVEAAGSLIVCLDPEGRITEWNPAASRLWDVSRSEALGEELASRFIGHRQREEVLDAIAAALGGESPEAVRVSVDGESPDDVRSILWHFTPLVGPEGRVRGVLAIGRDVTEQEKAEHELRLSREELRLLARHLSSVREAERSDIGREIHDQLGQSLTALKLHLSWFEGRDAEVPEDIAQWTRRMGRMIDGTLETVRRISRNLRPHVLEDLGFLAAVRWQTEEFTQRFDIPCRLRCEADSVELSPAASTQLFRILQESLTNVARHADATGVDVSVELEAGQVVLTVEDDGRGFDPNRIGVSTSVGLVGMRERALICGGEVEFSRGDEGGTRVVARFPESESGWS